MNQPNCQICEWMEEKDVFMIGEIMFCKAVGEILCSQENGSDKCKNLFKERINE